MSDLSAARAALRERQGVGARYDAHGAPAETLHWARLGTAYFARLLNELSDEELDAPSMGSGMTRRHVVAQISYQARALALMVDTVASGARQISQSTEVARIAEIENGTTLPARALRGLFHHAAVHLDVEWRDLATAAWDNPIIDAGGKKISIRDTPWIRARSIWLGAMDLCSNGSFLDMPSALIDRLIADGCRDWSGPVVRLALTDRATPALLGRGTVTNSITGAAADVAHWLYGYGARRITHDNPLPRLATSPIHPFQSKEIS